MAKKILLHNDCSMSTPSVFPKNWKTGGKILLKQDWRIQYYFYDPEFKDKYPYGKLIVVKGMNSFKELSERKSATISLLKNEITFNTKGYNPITKSYHEIPLEEKFDYEIHPNTSFLEALIASKDKLNVGEFTLWN